jgi:hypothetical protein
MLEAIKTRVSAVMAPDGFEFIIRGQPFVLKRVEQKDLDPSLLTATQGVVLVYMTKDQKNWYLCHRFNNTRGWLDEFRKGKTPGPIKAMPAEMRKDLVIYLGVVERCKMEHSIYNFVGNIRLQLPGTEYKRIRNLNKDDRSVVLYRFQPTGEFFVWSTLMAPNKTLSARIQVMRHQTKARGSTTNPKMREFCVKNSDKLLIKNFKLIDTIVVPFKDDMVRQKKDLIARHEISADKVITLIRSGR